MRCPNCFNPVAYPSLYSGECEICEFPLRLQSGQNYSWTISLTRPKIIRLIRFLKLRRRLYG